MKELEKTYNPADIEDRLYQKWLDSKYFHADAERGMMFVSSLSNKTAIWLADNHTDSPS